MTVKLKLFPVSGMNDKSRLLDVDLREGATAEELLRSAEQIAGKSLPEKGIMLILNGKALDIGKAAQTPLHEGDALWIMPVLSGG